MFLQITLGQEFPAVFTRNQKQTSRNASMEKKIEIMRKSWVLDNRNLVKILLIKYNTFSTMKSQKNWGEFCF